MLGVCQYSIAIRATYNFVRKIDNHTSMCYLLDVKTFFSEKQIMMSAFIALINPKKWQTVDSYHLKNGAKSRTCVWSTSNNLRLFLATLPCIKWSFIHQKSSLGLSIPDSNCSGVFLRIWERNKIKLNQN